MVAVQRGHAGSTQPCSGTLLPGITPVRIECHCSFCGARSQARQGVYRHADTVAGVRRKQLLGQQQLELNRAKSLRMHCMDAQGRCIESKMLGDNYSYRCPMRQFKVADNSSVQSGLLSVMFCEKCCRDRSDHASLPGVSAPGLLISPVRTRSRLEFQPLAAEPHRYLPRTSRSPRTIPRHRLPHGCTSERTSRASLCLGLAPRRCEYRDVRRKTLCNSLNWPDRDWYECCRL